MCPDLRDQGFFINKGFYMTYVFGVQDIVLRTINHTQRFTF